MATGIESIIQNVPSIASEAKGLLLLCFPGRPMILQSSMDAGKINMPPSNSVTIPAVALMKVVTNAAISQAVAEVTAPAAPLKYANRMSR